MSLLLDVSDNSAHVDTHGTTHVSLHDGSPPAWRPRYWERKPSGSAGHQRPRQAAASSASTDAHGSACRYVSCDASAHTSTDASWDDDAGREALPTATNGAPGRTASGSRATGGH